MDASEVRSVVRANVMEIYELEEEEIAGDANLYDDFAGDSIQKFELIAALERHFDIRYSACSQRMTCIDEIVELTINYEHE